MTSPLQDLLFRAAFLPGEPGLAAWSAWRAWVDLDRYLDPGSYRLLPELYRTLQGQGVDDPLVRKLKGLARLNWSKNQHTFRELQSVSSQLMDAGIDSIVTGGAGQALFGHADTPLDQPSSYELLVHLDDAIPAISRLQESGWRPAGRERVPGEPGWNQGPGCVTLSDQENRQVHIRYGQFGRSYLTGHGEQGLWERACHVGWQDGTFRVPGPEDQLLYIVGRNPEKPMPTVFLQAIDAMLVVRAAGARLDGEALCRLAQESGLLSPLQHMFGYIRTTLGRNFRAPGINEVLGLPLPARDALAFYLNPYRLTTWEHLSPELWISLRTHHAGSRMKKCAGIARLLARDWEWRYTWQVPVLGALWVQREVFYGTSL